jgi:hypothetical protein
VLKVERLITIGWIPKDWQKNAHNEQYISIGDTDTSKTFELSVMIEHDDDALVPKHSIFADQIDVKTGKVAAFLSVPIRHTIDDKDGDDWWQDDSELWATVAALCSSLAGGRYTISGAQLAGCWRIFNNESDDDDYEKSLGLDLIAQSGGEFFNEGGLFNEKFYIRYMVSFDGTYDDDEEKVIIATTV